MKYLALLRAINVSGKSKASMKEIRECFEEQGFENVSTYVNSGNVLFESDEKDETKLVKMGEKAIEKQLGFPVSMLVMSAKNFISAIDHAPDWWADGSPDMRHDAIFVIPPAKPNDMIKEIGSLEEGDEKIASSGNIIFWTVSTKAYGRSPVARFFNTSAYEKITLRSSTTTQKLYKLIKEK